MNDESLLKWLWLSLATSTGSALPVSLLKYFSSPGNIYDAGEEDLKIEGIRFYGHEKALLDKSLARAESILSWCRKNEVGIATPEDYFYPEKFRCMPNRPIVLYYLGNFCDLDTGFVAGIVGTRRPSDYALHAAKRISYDLARSGAVLCSGMASGIDRAAHSAALYHNSMTVGLIGCGIDRVYPAENRDLYEKVIEKGLLLSEYPPGSPPAAHHFPVRNRLIAALSDAVVVVEGSEHSGSLITAEEALRQKKKVYAVPGSIFSPGAAGSNFLLKAGAAPLLSAFDVVQDFSSRFPALKNAVPLFREEEKRRREAAGEENEAQSAPEKPLKAEKNLKKKMDGYVFAGLRRRKKKDSPLPPEFIDGDAPRKEEKTKKAKNRPAEEEEEAPEQRSVPKSLFLSPEEREVLERLSFEPQETDDLLRDGESLPGLLSLLTKLEIKGLAVKTAGGKYSLTDSAEA